MSNQQNVNQEAAVSTSSFTPEQLAEAAKILASQQQEVAEVAVEAVSPINQQKKDELIVAFNAMIENPRYWENENRIKRLEDALKLPKFDDRSLQQFYVAAKEELIKSAMKTAIQNKVVPVEPTEEEIEELAKQKKAAKEAKDAKKAAKKNS
jgi:hypothetical protein